MMLSDFWYDSGFLFLRRIKVVKKSFLLCVSDASFSTIGQLSEYSAVQYLLTLVRIDVALINLHFLCYKLFQIEFNGVLY